MKRFPIFLVAATLLAAVTATAQENRGRRSAREGIAHSRAYQQRSYQSPAARGGHAGRVVRQVVTNTPSHRAPTLRPTVRPTSHYAPRGHWQTVPEQVLVEPGHWHREYVPPTYGWVYDLCGHQHWGIVDPGGYRTVWCPPRYETRYRRVWVRC